MAIRTFVKIAPAGTSIPVFQEFTYADIANFLVAPSWKFPYPYTLFGLQVEESQIVGALTGGSDPGTENHLETKVGKDVIEERHRFLIGSPLSGVTKNDDLNKLIAFALESGRKMRPLRDDEIRELL